MKTYNAQSTMTNRRKQEIENNKQKWKKCALPAVKRHCINATYFRSPLHSSLKSYFWKARAIYYLGCCECWIFQASVVFLCSVKISFPIFLKIQGKIIISMTHTLTSPFLGRLFLVQSDWRVLIPLHMAASLTLFDISKQLIPSLPNSPLLSEPFKILQNAN